MLKKLYNKSKIWFAVFWIVVYCFSMSAGDLLSTAAGVEKSATLAVGIILSAALLLFLRKQELFKAYGLCLSKASARSMLYYLPVLIMLTANLWYGVKLNYGAAETVLYILSMFCVGFLEEIIFRGLLFNAMREDNLKAAVIVSAVTFGFGHIINLLNGSGAEPVSTLLQIMYAVAAGYMFVMIYLKTDSLLGCIAAHGAFNALSVFADETSVTQEMRILSAVILTVITVSYAAYLAWTMRGKNKQGLS